MAFPQVADITQTTVTASGTTHNISMPATVDAGDLLVIWIHYNAGTGIATINTPAGWTLLDSDNDSGNTQQSAVFVKKADGTEDGTTVNFSTTGSCACKAQVYRITAWADSGTLTADVEAVVLGLAAGAHDCPNLDPAGAADDTLWIACESRTSGNNITAAPTNYTNLTITNQGAGPLATARRELNSTSEDPGTFLASGGAVPGVVATIAVRPVAVLTNRAGRISQFYFEIPTLFPTVEEIMPTLLTASGTTHNISMPVTVNAGDLLLVWIYYSAGTTIATINTPSGWTLLANTTDPSNTMQGAVFVKKAAGTEGGTTVNFSTAGNCACKAQVYRISGWADSGTMTNDVEASILGLAAAAHDPPFLDPGSWFAENTLWIAGTMRSAGNNITAAPTNYTDLTITDQGAGPLATARRLLSASSEDPSNFTSSSNAPGIVVTIAVRPTVGAVVTPRAGRISWFQMQIPAPPDRAGRISQFNLVIPDLDRAGRISQFKFEIPTNDRSGQISQFNLTIPDFDKRGQISQFYLEIPSITVPLAELLVFTLLAELEIAFEVSLVNNPASNPWLASGGAWFYNLGTRTTIDNVRRAVTSVTVGGGHELNPANNVYECRNIDGSWVSYISQNEVYANPWGSINPNEAISLVRVKLYFSNYGVHYDGQYYEPRILLGPSDLNVRVTTNEALQGYALLEGQLRLANSDGFMDSILKDFIVIGQRLTLKTLRGTATNIGTKIVGEINRNDSIVTLKMWS